MQIDHFDGKSLRKRSDEWLIAAVADANLKLRECGDSPAHANMWRGLAESYAGEQVRRDFEELQNFHK